MGNVAITCLWLLPAVIIGWAFFLFGRLARTGGVGKGCLPSRPARRISRIMTGLGGDCSVGGFTWRATGSPARPWHSWLRWY